MSPKYRYRCFIIPALLFFLAFFTDCRAKVKDISGESIEKQILQSVDQHSKSVLRLIKDWDTRKDKPPGLLQDLEDYLENHYLVLAFFEEGTLKGVAGLSHLQYDEIKAIKYDFGRITKDNHSYFYKKLNNDTFLFFLINSRYHKNHSSLKIPPGFNVLDDINDGLSGDSIPVYFNDLLLCKLARQGLEKNESHKRLFYFAYFLFAVLIASSYFIKRKVLIFVFPAVSLLAHFALVTDNAGIYFRIFLYGFFVVYCFLPFRYLIKDTSITGKTAGLLTCICNLVILTAWTDSLPGFNKVVLFAVLFNLNFIFFVLLSRRQTFKRIIAILLVINALIGFFMIYMEEKKLDSYILLKLKTISLQEKNISNYALMDILGSIDKENIYEKLLSGRTHKTAFNVFKGSMASSFQKDTTIILFDSMGKIVDSFSLRNNMRHLNIESYIEEIFAHGTIEYLLENRTEPDIYISGQLLVKDKLIGGGIIVVCSMDYFDNDLQIENKSITDTLFSIPFSRPTWLKFVSERGYYYIAIKNTNIIHANRALSFGIPQRYLGMSVRTDSIEEIDIFRINDKKYKAYIFKQAGGPLLLFVLDDYGMLYNSYNFISRMFLSLLSLMPFFLFIIIPVIKKSFDFNSLRARVGISIVLLSLAPILLVFYVLQSMLSTYYGDYNINQVQNLSVNIKNEVNSQINQRTENILKSRVLDNFISGKTTYEGFERYLLSQFQDTPVNEIIISYHNSPVYELRGPSLQKDEKGLEGVIEYSDQGEGITAKAAKRFRDFEAVIVYSLSESFLKSIAQKFSADIGFRDKNGFFRLTTFDYALYTGAVSYNQGASLSGNSINTTGFYNSRYIIHNSGPDYTGLDIIVIKQLLPVFFLKTLSRSNAVIFSLIFLAVLVIIAKADSFIAKNINSFIDKLYRIKAKKINSINTSEIAINEFKRIADMINSLLETIYQNNLITNSLLENIPVAIFLSDSEDRELHSNITFNRWLQFLGDDIREFISDSSASSNLSEIKRDNTAKKVFRMDKYYINLNEDNMAKMIVISDMTSILELEEAKLRTRLAEKFAHDIKNPLMPVKLYIQHLTRLYEKDRKKFDRRFRQLADTVLNQVEIIENILARYAKLKRNGEETRKVQRIKELFQPVMDSFSLEDERADIIFIINDPDREVLIDFVEFFNTLGGLIRNSLESMKEKGRITVRESLACGDLIIGVMDNGPGIPGNVMERINRRNFASGKDKGLGIGMRLADDFVRRYKGKMDIDTGPGGTSITMTLPGILQ